MQRFRPCLGLLLLTVALLLPAGAARAIDDPGPGGGSWSGSSASDEIVQDYRIARNIAIGVSVVGFLGCAAWWALTADRPHERYRATMGITLFALVFLAAVLDKTVVQGIAGWFGLSPGELPLFWR